MTKRSQRFIRHLQQQQQQQKTSYIFFKKLPQKAKNSGKSKCKDGNCINGPSNEKWQGMVMAMKNAVTVKNTPHFSSTWAVTKNLDLMNLLTKKEVNESKIAREKKWKAAGSCEWT